MVLTWLMPKYSRSAVGQLIPVSRVESKRPDLLEDDSDTTVSAQKWQVVVLTENLSGRYPRSNPLGE